jgi:hypothetical protein
MSTPTATPTDKDSIRPPPAARRPPHAARDVCDHGVPTLSDGATGCAKCAGIRYH